MSESDPGRTCLSTLRENGIDWNRPPERLDAATLFAPAGELVPIALEALAPGGSYRSLGIHLSPIPQLDYAQTPLRRAWGRERRSEYQR